MFTSGEFGSFNVSDISLDATVEVVFIGFNFGGIIVGFVFDELDNFLPNSEPNNDFFGFSFNELDLLTEFDVDDDVVDFVGTTTGALLDTTAFVIDVDQ